MDNLRRRTLCSSGKTSARYEVDGYEVIDFKLPSGTLWATCNIGASDETEYGKYFMWGGTSGTYLSQVTSEVTTHIYDTKPSFFQRVTPPDLDTTTTGITMTKYNDLDNKLLLDPVDDAAYVNMGTNWRIPTVYLFGELYSYCVYKNCYINGVLGTIFRRTLTDDDFVLEDDNGDIRILDHLKDLNMYYDEDYGQFVSDDYLFFPAAGTIEPFYYNEPVYDFYSRSADQGSGNVVWTLMSTSNVCNSGSTTINGVTFRNTSIWILSMNNYVTESNGCTITMFNQGIGNGNTVRAVHV